MKKFFPLLALLLALAACGDELQTPIVQATGVSIAPETHTLIVGDKITLTATVVPADADNREVSWSSDKPDIAAVDAATGEVTAKANGIAVITAATKDGGYKNTSTITVYGSDDIRCKIPDPAFIRYVDYMEYEWDTNGNGIISLEEVAMVEVIDVGGALNVASLEGIEYFTALTRLSCDYNQITELDVSSLAALTNLNCGDNQIAELDVSSLTALTRLSCNDNQISELDVSSLTALTDLNCSKNKLTSLDVSNLTRLTDLDCDSNQITELDVSNLTRLHWLSCYSNQIAELDVSNLTRLTDLQCGDNQISELDVSKMTVLYWLSCYSNQITELDVSKNTKLKDLYCLDNQLTSLDISKNTALTNLSCVGNPGDGTIFPVTAWFDNNSIPADFTKGSWNLGGKTITVDYRKAN
jgi:hypothetical protein